jgi:catechol 2,3-dioxygenase-like lactoylglutathione lyase family enzyme
MKRAAILVRDMERSLEFWCDGLGLKVWREGRVGPDNDSFHRLLGLTPCHARFVILRSGELELGMVGLFQVIDPPLVAQAHLDRGAQVNAGEVVLVFHTDDAEAVHARALERGLTVVCPPVRCVLPELGVESLEMMIRDPNGVGVNCIQTIRSGGPSQGPG